MTNIASWKITMFNGKIHYFDWAIFNSYVELLEVTAFLNFLWRKTESDMSKIIATGALR